MNYEGATAFCALLGLFGLAACTAVWLGYREEEARRRSARARVRAALPTSRARQCRASARSVHGIGFEPACATDDCLADQPQLIHGSIRDAVFSAADQLNQREHGDAA